MSDFYATKADGTKVVYTDFDFNLNVHPVTKDFIMRTNEKAVIQALRNCVLASEGEFTMEGGIGGGVDELLFEINSPMIIFNTKRKIEETINNHERRIELKTVNVYRTEDMHGLIFEIEFYFSNNPDPVRELITVNRRR